MPKPIVSFAKQKDYRQDTVLTVMRRLLAPLGGMEAYVRPGDTVALKPNMLFGKDPGKAVTTHPSIVWATAKLAQEAGAKKILVGDSPGFGSVKSVARTCGIASIAEELGLELIDFTSVVNYDDQRTYKRLELAEELLQADAVINLPKLKTHGQMRMSMAVKNLFGTVVGTRKMQWHYRAGRERMTFAHMLNEIAAAINPSLSIVDAIISMDGAGPSAGTPNPTGFLAAGGDPWAVDAGLVDLLGIPRKDVFTLEAARQRGRTDWENYVAVGDDPHSLKPAKWIIPELNTLKMHGNWLAKHFPALDRWVQSQFTARPVANSDCTGCGRCAEICPAKAMTIINAKVAIDFSKCIYCYCCHELCPHKGLNLRPTGVLARLTGLRGDQFSE